MRKVWLVILYCIATVISSNRRTHILKFDGLSVPFEISETDGLVYFKEINNDFDAHYLFKHLEDILNNIDKLKNVSKNTKEELKMFIKNYILEKKKEQKSIPVENEDDSVLEDDLESVKEEIDAAHLPKYVKEKLKHRAEKFYNSRKLLLDFDSETDEMAFDKVILSEIKKMRIPACLEEDLIIYGTIEFAVYGTDNTTITPNNKTETPEKVSEKSNEKAQGTTDLGTTGTTTIVADSTRNASNNQAAATQTESKDCDNDNTTIMSRILLPGFDLIIVDKNKNESEKNNEKNTDKNTEKGTEKNTETTTEKITSEDTTGHFRYKDIPKIFAEAYEENEPKDGKKDGKYVSDYTKWWIKLYVDIMLDEEFRSKPICSGIFIWNNVIMTSAVCLNNHKNNLNRLYARTIDQQEFDIKRIGYKKFWTNSRIDLALLQTTEPMKSPQYAKIDQSDPPKEGDKVTVVSSKCEYLNSAKVKLNIKQCREVFGPQQSPFCGEPKSQTGRKCYENYGAPVIFHDNLVGLVSLSKMGQLSLYTNLSYLHEWWLPKIIYLQNVAEGFEGVIDDTIESSDMPKIIYMP